MAGAFYGELYLRSTLPFLSDAVTAREVDYLRRAFGDVRAPGPLLDLGCGHGRHAAALARSTPHREVVGLELDPLSLERRLSGFPAVRADLRALPFRRASFAGAYAWYSSLFLFEDRQNAQVLGDIAAALKPGARLVLHTVPFERLAAAPAAHFQTRLPDGSQVTEESRFDGASGVDRGVRRLQTAEGRELSAEFAIRYYPLPELKKLLADAGLAVRWVHGSVAEEPLCAASTDLIVGADVDHG